MIQKELFLEKFSAQFDDLENELKFETIFHEIGEWSSLVGVCILAMAEDEFGINIQAAELRACKSVEDAYNLFNSKVSEK